jgi:hypothetical protein
MSGRTTGPSIVFGNTEPSGPLAMFGRYDIRAIGYWLFTLLLVYENAAGFVWTLLQIEYLRVMLAHLGYPPYFANILGPWQLACAAALIAPRFPVVREWAYAGAFFNYSSAVISHLFVGDGPDKWTPAFLFAVFTVCSWALRPADRRLPRSRQVGETPVRSWIVAIAILILMLVVALFTLPAPPRF